MKNLLTKLMVAVLCLCLVLAFAACNDSSPASNDDDNSKPSSSTESEPEVVTIVGKWEGSWDMFEDMDFSEEEKQRFQSFDFNVLVTYNFNEDGTCTMKTNADGLKPAANEMAKYFIEVTAEENGISYNDYISATGMREEAVIEQYSKAIIESFFTGDLTGKYKFEDGKLFMVDAEEEFKDGDYTTCELSANTLKFIKDYVDGEPQEDGTPEMVFTKVK